MTVGRKPSIAAARTNASKKVQPADIPAAGAFMVTELHPPSWMDEEAIEIWNAFIPQLVSEQKVEPRDVPLLIQLVTALQLTERYRVALYELHTHATVDSRDTRGNVHELSTLGSPEDKRLRVAWQQSSATAQKLAGDFGMNPVSRIRLGLAGSKAATFGELMAQGD